MNRIQRLIAGFAFVGLLGANAFAHNNPTFREEQILTVAVTPSPGGDGSNSKPFSVQWPDKTVQLIWRVRDIPPESVRFAVTQNAQEVLTDVGHGSATKRLKGDGIAITRVVGATQEFQIEIFAKILDRHVDPQQADRK